jgi:signal transduction histidine kinase
MNEPAHLRRDLDRALIGGVCAGIGDYLGVDALAVRIGLLAIVAASGVGIVIYPLAWALIPAQPGRSQTWRSRLLRWREAAAIIVFSALVVFAAGRLGLWVGARIVWPLVLASCGLALILRQTAARDWIADDAAPQRAGRFPPALWRRWPAGVLGSLLFIGATLFVLHAAGIMAQTGRSLAATVVIAFILALVMGPYLLSLARRLSVERAQRIRSEERSEVAAHLHDSVLQTLALIQRRADDPSQVVGLARQQERELREWLLGTENGGARPETLRAALERAAQEIETRHAVLVETVTVGDCPLDDRLEAMVAAAREALVNAAKFSGVGQIDIYAEVSDGGIEVFVRDRGVGFDPAAVPDDRQGIRRSIQERMERHGGRASVRSAPGQGTEVELAVDHVPR